MPIFRVQWFYEVGPWGWSEHMYCDQPDIDAARLSVLRVTPPRVIMLPRPTILSFIRISDIAEWRDSQLIAGVDIPQGTPATQPYSSGEAPEVTLAVRLERSAFGRRTLFMRNLPDGMGQNGQRFQFPAAFLTQLNTWVDALKRVDNLYGHYGENFAEPEVAVTAFEAAPAVMVTAPGLVGVAVGDTVRIRNTVWTGQRYNGRFKVIQVAGNNYTLKATPSSATTYVRGGFIRKFVQTFGVFSRGVPSHIGGRDTGRPSGLPVGRRRRS